MAQRSHWVDAESMQPGRYRRGDCYDDTDSDL